MGCGTVINGPGKVKTIIVTRGIEGKEGRQGPPGPAGGAAFEMTAGATLSALVVVWEDESGFVWPLSNTDEEHVAQLSGVTITSAQAGEVVIVQRSGPLVIDGLGLDVGRVWLGLDGRMTQTPPEDGYDVLIGYVTADRRIYLDFSDAIEL